jgi:DNA ligase (NAD+)
VREGLVRELPGLFDLRAERLLPLEGFAEKSSQKLVEALARASHAELPRFLYGLGIPEVGVTVARDLARHFGSFAALRAATPEQLQEVPGVGPRMAEAITAFFADPGYAVILDELLNRVTLRETAGQAAGAGAAAGAAASGAAAAPLAGKRFVFTGGLTAIPRRRAQELIEGLGARATGSVSKATDYVVVGEDAGSKAEDARRLGVTVLDEGELLALLREHGVKVEEQSV